MGREYPPSGRLAQAPSDNVGANVAIRPDLPGFHLYELARNNPLDQFARMLIPIRHIWCVLAFQTGQALAGAGRCERDLGANSVLSGGAW